jgi:hypothetical protein
METTVFDFKKTQQRDRIAPPFTAQSSLNLSCNLRLCVLARDHLDHPFLVKESPLFD